jgi:hypothetical protein
MGVLKFIFVLGINFSIFGFIWGVIMLGVRLLIGTRQTRSQTMDYVLRIIKYFLLVSVTANFIMVSQGLASDETVSTANMILGVFVLALYLLGKLQNRSMLSQIAQNPMMARFSSQIDPKIERFLLIGSLLYFIVCLQFPVMVSNGVVTWFTAAIINIYDTPIIGWVFSVIAFFFLLTILFRAANVIGRILNGQPINGGNSRGGGFGGQVGSNPFEQFRQKQTKSDDFVDYEDVTDYENEKDSQNKNLN